MAADADLYLERMLGLIRSVLAVPFAGVSRETARERGLDTLVVIQDTTTEPLPFVLPATAATTGGRPPQKTCKPASVRSAMSMPLRSTHDGAKFGYLRVADWVPRLWGASDIHHLQEFACLIEVEIERQEVLREAAARMAEAAEKEQRYRVAADLLGQGLLLTDREGRIRYVNTRVVEITGYSAEELLGEEVSRFLPLLKEAEVLSETQRYEMPLQNREGHSVWCTLRIKPFRDMNDQSAGTLAVLSDVTAQRAAEQNLYALTEKLERSNETLQEFATIASHDLQEPLRKIQAFGDRLRARTAGTLTPEAQDALNRMLAASERMQSIIQDLLMYSRVYSRRAPFAPVDLNKVLTAVLQEDFAVVIARTEARITTEPLAVVEADAAQMHQLFQHLIGNALKFHKEGEPPRIHIGCQCIGYSHTSTGELTQESETSTQLSGTAPRINKGMAETCRLSIRDEGIGFDARYAERVFEVFERLHVRGAFEGNGIGLAICRRIVERHGGAISAQSEPEKGTTITVLLPMASGGMIPDVDPVVESRTGSQEGQVNRGSVDAANEAS